MSVDSLILFIFFIVILIAEYCKPLLRKHRARKSNDKDPFFNEVSRAKAKMESNVLQATKQHAQELNVRFRADLELKERLSRFARDNNLDDALVALWDEIKYYPSWSKREDFAKWNILELSGISGSEDKDIEEVKFNSPHSRYRITKRNWSGMEDEGYADFSLFENGEEVFAVKCSVEYDEGGNTYYSCFDISALRKCGNWAKDLLGFYERIQIKSEKSRAGFQYMGAENISKRFAE